MLTLHRESFIQQYFAKMVVKATQWTQQAASAPPAALPPAPLQPPPSYQESNRQAPGNPRHTLFD